MTWAPGASAVTLTVRRTLAPIGESEQLLSVHGGRIDLATIADLPFPETLELELSDVVLGTDTFAPNGLVLRDLELRLDHFEVLEGRWDTDGKTAHIEGVGSWTLAWALDAPERAIPLRSVRLDEVAMGMDVAMGPHGPQAVAIYGVRDRVFWRYGGIIEFADLVLSLQTAPETR